MNYYKIGISEDPHRRLTQHQSSIPFTLELVTSYKHAHAKYLELALLHYYLPCHVRGEWFSFTNKTTPLKAYSYLHTLDMKRCVHTRHIVELLGTNVQSQVYTKKHMIRINKLTKLVLPR